MGQTSALRRGSHRCCSRLRQPIRGPKHREILPRLTSAPHPNFLLKRQLGEPERNVFTYRGEPLRSANTRAWRAALKACGIRDFRWHDLRHTWATWLRQNDVPTGVLQELGGWKSETMVRRYAHLSVKHLQPYANQLIFPVTIGESRTAAENSARPSHKSGHSGRRARLHVVVSN